MRRLLLLLFALASCSTGAAKDLPAIGKARSLIAEWALVNEQERSGHLTHAYVRTMRAALHEQLQTAAQSLTRHDSRFAAEIAATLREPSDADPQQLERHAEALKRLEDALEST